MATAQVTLFDFVVLGGWTMVPLVACSVVATFVAVRKVLVWYAAGAHRVDVLRAVDDFMQQRDRQALVFAARRLEGPLAALVVACAQTSLEAPHRVADEARRVAAQALARQVQGLGLLAFIAQAAPLFGLLGTVIGMVDLFSSMQGSGTLQTSLLSSGIWKALLTTVAGLAIAIPVLGLHAWFEAKVEALRLRLDDVASRLVTALEAAPRDGARP